ncbi:MAG TPA: YbaK/EbsC family protein [Gammaproteobacteria bacterium]|nr:YbaK/EbsC family protein [Gammaproteobacteria bacterium]
MAVAATLREYLNRWGVEYELVPHTHTSSSLETAEAAHVPGDKLAKCVMTEDYRGYLMVVVPASHEVEFSRLDEQLDRRLELATEEELADIFVDCELGAIPPLGEAYGIDVAVDSRLAACDDVYFEAGDHAELLHLRGEDFRDLMAGAEHGNYSRHL